LQRRIYFEEHGNVSKDEQYIATTNKKVATYFHQTS